MASQKSRRCCRRVRPAGAAAGPDPLPPKEPLPRATSATTIASAASDGPDGEPRLATGVPIEVGAVAAESAGESEARRKEARRREEARRKVARLHERIWRTGFLGDPPAPTRRVGETHASKAEGESKALLEAARPRGWPSRAGLVAPDLPVAVAVPVDPREDGQDDDAVEAPEAECSEARRGRRRSMSLKKLRTSITRPRVASRASTTPAEAVWTTSSRSM